MESKTQRLDQMRHVLRLKPMRIRTEEAYVPERPCKRSCGTGL